MESELAIEASREAIKVCLLVGGPILAVCLLVGLLMGFAQAMSHIQDQALATIPKILAIFAVVGFALPWFADRMIDFSKQQFSQPMLAAGSPRMESQPTGEVPSLFEKESLEEDSYYPRLQTQPPRWQNAARTTQASFAREKTQLQLPSLKTKLDSAPPEAWLPPTTKRSATPFQLPSYRFSRRPSANVEG